MMDPWSIAVCHQETVILTSTSDLSPSNCHLAFEDNFKPSVAFEKLPDSDEYLAVLEEKLKKLKSDPNILRQLAEKREACMQQLLEGDIQVEETAALDTLLPNSVFLRTVFPHKQALTQGEAVDLVKYDQLLSDSDVETESVKN